MLNQTIIVGRLVKEPTLKTTENGHIKSDITVAVNRSYKNSSGVYDTDFIDCTLWHTVAENTSEYCNKGDMIGIKGRIQTRMIEDENGNKRKHTEIIGEKITFLSSNKEKLEKQEKAKKTSEKK
ncbi:MAG: single-stranded DNA-binding protein [bacterium]|nr:single-stranded DNA-binding protein [bacterium]